MLSRRHVCVCVCADAAGMQREKIGKSESDRQ